MFLPCEDTALREEVMKRKPAKKEAKAKTLSPSVEASLLDVIVKEVMFANRIEFLKRRLHWNCFYSSEAAFRTIDLRNTGVITKDSLDSFFLRNNLFLIDLQVLAIIRRIDYEGDTQITFGEFEEFLRPSAIDVLSKSGPILLSTAASSYAPLLPLHPAETVIRRTYVDAPPPVYTLPCYNMTDTTTYISPSDRVVKTITT